MATAGWRLFWGLVGYVAYIVALIFLYFYKPFADLFTRVVNGVGYDNAIFWAAMIVGLIGFCSYHWRAYQIYIVQRQSIDSMVLASLRGSTFVAVLLSAGAALQSVQILCVYLLGDGYNLGAEFAARLGAVLALTVLTGIFCIVFWLLKVARPTAAAKALD